MPLVPEDDTGAVYLRSPLGGPAPPAEAAPNAAQTVAAAFRLQNAPYNVALMLHGQEDEPVAGYNPFNDIKGTPYEEYASRFAFSLSPSETSKIKARIEEENQARRTLDASGHLGTAAQVLAGLLDPTVFLPGGTIYRGARYGYSLARTAASTGLAGAAQAAIQEAVLQTTQSTRTPSESLANLGTATVLSALLGGAAGVLVGKAERAHLERGIDNLRADLAAPADRSAGAASATRNLELAPILPTWLSKPVKRAGAAVTGTVRKVPYVGDPVAALLEKVGGVPEYLATKTGPMLRIMTGPSAEARKGLVELAEVPLRTEANIRGETTAEGVPLEREIRTALRQAEFHLTQQAEEAFREFRFGTNDVKFAKLKAAIGARFGNDGMTFDRFMEEVDHALRNGDKHDIPQVQQLAQQFRQIINAPYEKAVKLGLLEDGAPLGAESYAPRRIVRDKLIAQKPQFLQNYVEWRRGDQATKAQLQDKLSAEWDALRQARIEGRKLEGRIATAQKRLGELETRLSERGQEATAATKRAGTVEARNQEAQAATKELRDFIGELKARGANRPEITDQIRQMEGQLRDIEQGSQLVSEKDLDAIDKAERQGILTGNMRRVARVVAGKVKPPKPPSFWKWVAQNGGLKAGLANADARSAPGLVSLNGRSLDDLQQRLAEEFPELRAQGYGKEEGWIAQNFGDQIVNDIEESIAGREPDWFLNEKWNSDDRFVAEWSEMLDQAAHDVGVRFETTEQVADFFRGEAPGMEAADYDAIMKSVDESAASPVARAEGEGLQGRIAIRQGTLDLFKDTLKQARKQLVSRETKGNVAGARAQEAGVAQKRNLGRLGLLNERARIAEKQGGFLEAMRSHAAEQEQAARGRIEQLLQQWEGKSSKGARSALERRAAAEEGRGPGAQRLASADAEVEKAVRDILKSDQAKTDTELADEAEQTFNEYIGTPDGRLPKDDPAYGALRPPTQMQGRGPLIARRNPMPDNMLAPFLDRNPLRYTHHYLRSMLSDIGMFERTGDFEGTSVLKAIDNEASLAARNATTDAERLKIYQERDRMIADYAAVRDRLKGVYGYSADSFLRKAGEISQALGDYDVLTNMGMSGVAQIPDFANIVARYAFSGALRPAMQSLINHLSRMSDTFKKAKQEFGPIVGATELFLQSRGREMADMGDVYQPATKFAKILRTGADVTMTLSGTAFMTDWEKTLASVAASTSFLKAAKAVSEGRASAKQVSTLAEANISQGMARKIWKEFTGPNGGEITPEGAYMTNTANWGDPEARRFFEAAIGRDVDIAVATPGEEKPLFLSNPITGLIGKYKSFVAASNTRILLANLQRRDASTLSGIIAMLGLGMVVSAIRSQMSGVDISNRRPQDWVKEAVDRAGWLGWLGEFNAMSAQATAGSIDLYRLIGADRPLSRFASRDVLGTLTGPIGGKIETVGQLGGAAGSGNWTASDVRKLRQLIPFQNLFYLRGLIDQVEAGARDTFGIQQRAH